MKNCKVIIEGYGKIDKAEIEPAPLTFFVGDNNSGKSYILSLLWAFQTFGVNYFIPVNMFKLSENGIMLEEWMKKNIEICIKKGEYQFEISEMIEILQDFLNDCIDKRKEDIIKRIFNSDEVSINKMMIKLTDVSQLKFTLYLESDFVFLRLSDKYNNRFGIHISDYEIDLASNDRARYHFIHKLYSLMLGICFWREEFDNSIYMPAARTGFMLTKNIINQVGRNIAFNIDADTEQVTPFIRPINQFLDIINSLSVESKGNDKFISLIEYIESGMSRGKVEINDMPGKDVMYVPNGKDRSIPLRATSAVVSELSPLILILKHFKDLGGLYYEEPEMCLHPQLQHRMAKVLCNLANVGVDMVVTTHSDIIIQYVNNMISLSERADKNEICEKLGYKESDLVDRKDVKVYQFKALDNGESQIIQLKCGNNGFVAETFNDALDDIMSEAYIIQE